MDEGIKKKIVIVVAVLSLAAVGVVTYNQVSPDDPIAGVPADQTVLLKCRECKADFVVPARDYHRHVKAKDPMRGIPAYVCADCGQEAAMLAYKCPKCENVFWKDAAGPTNFEDCCPKCGFSAIEEARKNR